MQMTPKYDTLTALFPYMALSRSGVHDASRTAQSMNAAVMGADVCSGVIAHEHRSCGEAADNSFASSRKCPLPTCVQAPSWPLPALSSAPAPESLPGSMRLPGMRVPAMQEIAAGPLWACRHMQLHLSLLHLSTCRLPIKDRHKGWLGPLLRLTSSGRAQLSSMPRDFGVLLPMIWLPQMFHAMRISCVYVLSHTFKAEQGTMHVCMVGRQSEKGTMLQTPRGSMRHRRCLPHPLFQNSPCHLMLCQSQGR